MDLEKIAEKLKDLILGDLKEEFKEFKNSVTGELAGYRLAIESINGRIANLEEEVRDLRRALNETNKRIDETRAELKLEIAKNTERMDHLNSRVDSLSLRVDNLSSELSKVKDELANIRIDLNRALSQKEIVNDLLIRVERLEARLAA